MGQQASTESFAVTDRDLLERETAADIDRNELPENFHNLWDFCLQRHYRRNRHHPEFFRLPESEMTCEDRIELTCDLLGSVMGHAYKSGIHLRIADCRALIEKQKWRHWAPYAEMDPLPAASPRAPELPQRWRQFPAEEKESLKRFYFRYRNGEDEKTIRRDMLGPSRLPCVSYYMRDLGYHRKGVKWVWAQIPEFRLPGMHERIEKHDDDKYELVMIIGYISKWCF